jgi:hypothetical protein
MNGSGERCPEHREAYPCSQPIWAHWIIEDGEDGWYVVRPFGQGRCGPFSEEEAARRKPELMREYPMTGGIDWASGDSWGSNLP